MALNFGQNLFGASAPELGAVASFDYFDLAEGVGVVDYQGTIYKNSISSSAILLKSSRATYTTDTKITSGPVLTNNTMYPMTKVNYVVYDLAPYNYPREIKGHAIFHGSWSIAAVAATQISAALNLRLAKWDGTTETAITSASGSLYVNAPNVSGFIEFIDFNVPRTHFKKGEQLRLAVETYVSAIDAIGGTLTTSIHNDPATATTSMAGILKLSVPYNIRT